LAKVLLFTINFFFAVFFGLSCSLFPGWTLRLYGLVPDAAAIWVSRLVGGSLLGFATLLWFGRKTSSVEARRAIALALLVQDAIGWIASAEIQLTGRMNAFGWSNLVLYGILTLAYATFFFIRPNDC
jgi:hypothetical protein